MCVGPHFVHIVKPCSGAFSCTNSEKHFCVKSSNLVGSDSCWSIASFLKGFDWLLNLVVFTLPMVVMN